MLTILPDVRTDGQTIPALTAKPVSTGNTKSADPEIVITETPSTKATPSTLQALLRAGEGTSLGFVAGLTVLSSS